MITEEFSIRVTSNHGFSADDMIAAMCEFVAGPGLDGFAEFSGSRYGIEMTPERRANVAENAARLAAGIRVSQRD